MFDSLTRRDILKHSATAGAALGFGNLGFLARLSPVSAQDAQLDSNVVRLRPEIEPVVRLIETTPRDRLLEEVADRIRRGLSYRELLAALLLAGVKNVEPRPSVGFKFHTVLVVNSAHVASMASPPAHRWLPIFWALDYYKSAAARDVTERGDWTMSQIDDATLPPAHRARDEFTRAMDNWDAEAVDPAIAALARSAGASEVYELFFRYGMRDYRSIGHKAIYVANSWRTLQCIGWQHAEPVLRSLAYALLAHEGDNPARRDDPADRPFRNNQELIRKIRDDWRNGETSREATDELVEVLRAASPEEASQAVVDLLNRGVAPQSIWDAIHLAAGELVLRQPAIVALHAVTTTNALAFAYQTTADDETRRLLMLQNAAFLPMFLKSMSGRGALRERPLETLSASSDEALPASPEEVFAELRNDPVAAARGALALLGDKASGAAAAKDLIDKARMLVFLKGDNAHDYKFSSAILEDYYHVSPQVRDQYLAANILLLRSSADRDNALVERTRAALGA